MKIKDRLIKALGGYTFKEYRNKDEDFPAPTANIISVYAESRNYYIDEDSLEVEKEQLAYKLGKEMLDHELIDFSIKEKLDDYCAKIYTIRAKAYVKEINE